MIRFSAVCCVVLALFTVAGKAVGEEQSTEPELTIVKYGKLTVKSPLPEAKVFVDDTYQGHADSLIENITVGSHTISCRTNSQSATGKFMIKKDEVLLLEADYQQGKLLSVVERETTEKAEKAEQEKKVKAEAPKPQPPKPQPLPPKKIVVEAKKEEKKNPVEERRALHLNVLKMFFEDADSGEIRVTNKTNQKVVSKYAEKKSRSGTYYRTKKNILLCEAGPCEEVMSASFVYTDDTGNVTNFGLTWKQTVFNGITPTGTSKRDLLFCVNGACQNLEDKSVVDATQSVDAGRYRLIWSRTSLVIRRSDIEKEIADSGGAVDAY